MNILRNLMSRVSLRASRWVALGGRRRKVDLDRLKEELRNDEGLRLKVYTCTTGHRTIGYGHMVDKNPSIRDCTLDEAERWMEKDILAAIQIADVFLWPDNLHSLTEPRQRALVNMTYNIGFNICKFKRLREAIKEKDWAGAAREVLDSVYAKQVGERAIRVAKLWENSDAGV
jgi:lysozyme